MDKLVSLIAVPTDKTKIIRYGKINAQDYQTRLENIARTMIENVKRINIIPDEGVPLDFSRIYRSFGGEVFGYIPEKGYQSLEKCFHNCDKIIKFGNGWNRLNTCLSLEGDIITVLGMSPGTIVEIAYTKYHNKYFKKNIPILIDHLVVKNKISKEIAEDLNLFYFSNTEELRNLLVRIKEAKR